MASLVFQCGETRLTQIVCVVVKGHWNSLLKSNIVSNLTSTTMDHLLLILSQDGFRVSWAFFQWVESNLNNKHSLQSTWTMVHTLVKHKHFKTAQNLLEKIAVRDYLSSPSVLTSLVRSHDDLDSNSQILSWLVIFYAKSRMTQDAIQVFEHMRVHGFKPQLHACTVLLNSLAKVGLTDMVWKVYEKMVRVGVSPNVLIFNVLIHACSKSGDVEKAESLLNEMVSRFIFPDLFTFNTMISLYCKKGMHYEALGIQGRMEREGISPDIVTYNSLIYGFCREGRMREALGLFREIKGATPNHVTYTTLIDGYCRVNDLEEASRLRGEMEVKGLCPGVITYNTILSKLCEEGRIRDANKLLNEMSERKVEPDNVTCNTLINAYCKIGDMVSAMKVKQKMVEAALQPDHFTFKALIHGSCKLHEVNSAKEFLFEMLDAGFSANYSTYSWLVDVYCHQGNKEVIIGLPDELSRKGLSVNISVYRALIGRLCKLDKIESAERIFTLMQVKGMKGDSVVCTSLAYAYFKSGKVIAALDMLDEMAKRRLIITIKIYQCFCASNAGDGIILGLFWAHVIERGLISRNILKHIQELNVNSCRILGPVDEVPYQGSLAVKEWQQIPTPHFQSMLCF